MAPHNATMRSTALSPTVSSREKAASRRSWTRWLWTIIMWPYRSISRRWWAWEIASAVFSLASTIVLVIVLATQNGKAQTTYKIGSTHVTLNTIVAAISTAMRTSLALAVAGPLNQSAWNWFAQSRRPGRHLRGRPLNDLDTFSEASSDSISSLKLLWRTRCWYAAQLSFPLKRVADFS
jgi:hypothetical protein